MHLIDPQDPMRLLCKSTEAGPWGAEYVEVALAGKRLKPGDTYCLPCIKEAVIRLAKLQEAGSP